MEEEPIFKMTICGLFYKNIMILNDTSRVVRMMLQAGSCDNFYFAFEFEV